MTAARVILRPKRAKPFFSRHPWVYPGAIAEVVGEPADGAVVDVVSHGGNFVARGLYNSKSKIRVRLYSWNIDVALDAAFFRNRLQKAIHLRHNILKHAGQGSACRLVFSEADGLSGLTIDQFDRWLVVQFTSLGLAQQREMFADLLTELLQPEGIYLRTERGIGKLEGLDIQDGVLRGTLPTAPLVIEENGIRFLVDLAEGQKTGFYLDQRDNRPAVARFAAGRRVLDAFCYTGGFGLYAARAGASEVVGVDVSEPALRLAAENARINELTNIRFDQSEVFTYLDGLVERQEKFGLVVLDPPKFARAQHSVEEALRGYRRLQGQALRLLESDGILVTCCCSGLITRDMLYDLMAQLTSEVGRGMQVLESRGQAADHPVSVWCPETSYLKCLICRVE